MNRLKELRDLLISIN